jgi:hypothetical protein
MGDKSHKAMAKMVRENSTMKKLTLHKKGKQGEVGREEGRENENLPPTRSGDGS